MKQYIVDAFAEELFGGNQAAVCVLDKWIPDQLMMRIASENNFSETAFVVKETNGYHLRWFTPGGEIDLCGHATLACAFVLFEFYGQTADKVIFATKSGQICVQKKENLYAMDMPAYELVPVPVTDEMEEAIGIRPLEAWMGRDLVCVLEDEQQIYNAAPDFEKMKKVEGLLVHITAKGKDYTCVSRSFAPKLNVTEDPVCGSGHCHIAPLWAEKLHTNLVVARQASKRGGTLYCEKQDDRLLMAGSAVLYAISELYVEDILEANDGYKKQE